MEICKVSRFTEAGCTAFTGRRGISTVALNVEFFRDSNALDLALGTWSFRDLSVSAVAKHYFGANSARPVAGAFRASRRCSSPTVDATDSWLFSHECAP